MKQVNLAPYTWNSQEYKVKEVLYSILLSPTRGLKAVALLEAYDLAKKIKNAGDSIILETVEWEELKTAVEKFDGQTMVFEVDGKKVTEKIGFREVDIEMIERVLKADEFTN